MPYTVNASKLHEALRHHADLSENRFRGNHPHAHQYFQDNGITPAKIRDHAARLLASGAVAGTLFLASPALSHPTPHTAQIAHLSPLEREKQFSKELKRILPIQMQNLNSDQETKVSNLIFDYWGINAKAVLQGERLNRSYGYIGAEQHLPRYPGDTAEEHGEFIDKGITPGRGGWGYFAYSKEALTQDLVEKEKWYVAVQTLYLPDWRERLKYLVRWYKYRKVLLVNPTNGKTVVCDVADAGPSDWTGKHFGGSPEVMAYLKLNVGMQKGPVTLFFVDDPDNKIPLGPVEKPIPVKELVER